MPSSAPKIFALLGAAIAIVVAVVLTQSGDRPTPSTTNESSAIWVISDVTKNEITYRPIDWFGGDEAIEEAKKDGCTGACAPGGFYWRYTSDAQSWVVNDSSQIAVELICNSEDCFPEGVTELTPVDVSFRDYVSAEALCGTSLDDCRYYSIGMGFDFFDVTFTADGHLETMTQRYVP